MSEFKKGETVQLNSGGPIMTVIELGDFSPLRAEDGVKCTWFEGSKLEEEVFDAQALKRASLGIAVGARRRPGAMGI